ncbi:MAG TPA: MFS transporter [Noviherbaspirillum sp.]
MTNAATGTGAQLLLSPVEIRGVMAGLMLAILLGALDQTIVSVALPRMSSDLSGLDQLAWVVSGYLVAVAVSTPIYGKLGDLYGRRIVLSAAIVIFILTSVACALASSMEMLVIARVLQGLGGGGLISVATTTVADVVAPRERGRYQAYISGAYALANVSGPIIGGLLTEHLSWRWIFWINLPLGLLALWICRRVLARLPVPTGRRGHIDFPGAVLLAAGLSAILVALARIGQGLHDAGEILPLFAFGALLLAAYVWLERRTAEPLVPLRIFRYPAVTICCALLFIIFFELVSLTVLVPMRVQMASGARVDLAALHLLPLTLAMPIGSLGGGWWMSRTGRYKPVQLLGAAMVPFALALLAFIDAGMPILGHCLLGLGGLGLGIQIPAVMAVVQNAVPREHLGVVTAASSFFRAFGAAVGTAVLTALLLAALSDALPAGALAGGEFLSETLHAAAAGMDAAGRGSLKAIVYGAYREIFLAGALVALVSVGLGLRLQNGTLGGASGATPGARP